MKNLVYILVACLVLVPATAHERPFDDEFSQSLVEKGKKQLSVRSNEIIFICWC